MACGKSTSGSSERKAECAKLEAIFIRNIPKAFSFLEAEYDDPNFAAAPHRNSMDAARKVATQLEVLKLKDPELAKIAGQTGLIIEDYIKSLAEIGAVLSKMSGPAPEVQAQMKELESAATELSGQCEPMRPGCKEILKIIGEDADSPSDSMPLRAQALEKVAPIIKDKALAAALIRYTSSLTKMSELLAKPDKSATRLHVIEAQLRSFLQAADENGTKLKAACTPQAR